MTLIAQSLGAAWKREPRGRGTPGGAAARAEPDCARRDASAAERASAGRATLQAAPVARAADAIRRHGLDRRAASSRTPVERGRAARRVQRAGLRTGVERAGIRAVSHRAGGAAQRRQARARARTVELSLSTGTRGTVLRVRDDGTGFGGSMPDAHSGRTWPGLGSAHHARAGRVVRRALHGAVVAGWRDDGGGRRSRRRRSRARMDHEETGPRVDCRRPSGRARGTPDDPRRVRWRDRRGRRGVRRRRGRSPGDGRQARRRAHGSEHAARGWTRGNAAPSRGRSRVARADPDELRGGRRACATRCGLASRAT